MVVTQGKVSLCSESQKELTRQWLDNVTAETKDKEPDEVKMENWTVDSSYPNGVISQLDAFRGDNLRKNSILYSVWLGIAFLFAIVTFFTVQNMQMRALPLSLFMYFIILTAHILFRLRLGKANILAPDIIYVGFYTLFHLGYITLYALNLIEYSDEIIRSQESMPRSMFIINLGLLGFIFGYELLIPARYRNVYNTIKTPTQMWLVLGTTLLAIGLAVHIACLFVIGIPTIMREGYVVIANVARYTSSRALEMVFWASTMIGIMGAIVTAVSSALRYRKLFHSKVAMTLTATFSVIFLLEGDRGYFVQMCMPLLLMRHYFIKKISIKVLIIIVLGLLIVMSGISAVRTVVFDPSKMLEEFKYQRSTGVVDWKSPFVETGGTFKIPSLITSDVPEYAPYWNGQSYFNAMIRMVPFLDGITLRMGLRNFPPSYGSSPAQWITYRYAGFEGAGLGFSVCAEGYLNFGYAGAFLELAACGLFLRFLTVKFSRQPSPAWAIIMLGCLGASITTIRGDLQSSLTPFCTQIFVLSGILTLICRNEPSPVFEQDDVYGIQEGTRGESLESPQNVSV